jgi:hypothetical protein
VRALAIGLVAGAALCGVASAPASAMPMGNLATAVSDLALGQNVRYVCNRYRCRWRPNSAYRPGGYYGNGPSYDRPSYGPSYYGPSYAPSYYGSGSGGSGYALGWPGGFPGGLYGGGLYGRWWW